MFARDRYRNGYDRYLEPVASPPLVYEQSLPYGSMGLGSVSNADRLIAKAVNNPGGLAAEAIKAEYELETLHIVLISLAILLAVLVVLGGAICVRWRINRRRSRAISAALSASSGVTSGCESDIESRNGRRSACYGVACI